MIVGETFKEQLISEGINPDEVSYWSSEYNQETDVISTTLKMDDGSTYKIEAQSAWYASRKNKKW